VDPRFSSMKFIVPDVTAVGRNPGGPTEKRSRVWFGMRPGLLPSGANSFEKTDVTQGFFIIPTDIQSCRAFPSISASRERRNLRWAPRKLPAESSVSVVHIPGAHGSITGLACGEKPGVIYADTSAGETCGGGGLCGAPTRKQVPALDGKHFFHKLKNRFILPSGDREGPGERNLVPAGRRSPSKGVAYFIV